MDVLANTPDDLPTGDGGPWDVERAKRLIDLLDEVDWEFGPPEHGWRYGGGRDLNRLVERRVRRAVDSLSA
ncbi:hypothetical protein GCM10009745_78120 [Kribbella yunnanensis]|uniref:Uncharacterized protein n=1 Tax=Kribbella yunnanensis TaxID=190194 RepID=A0ABP4V6X8_9ACTN